MWRLAVICLVMASSGRAASAQWHKTLVDVPHRPAVWDLNFNGTRLACMHVANDGHHAASTFELFSTGGRKETVLESPLGKARPVKTKKGEVEVGYIPLALAFGNDKDEFLVPSTFGAHFWQKQGASAASLKLTNVHVHLKYFTGWMSQSKGGDCVFFWFQPLPGKNDYLPADHYQYGHLFSFDRWHVVVRHGSGNIEAAALSADGQWLFTVGGGAIVRWRVGKKTVTAEGSSDLTDQTGKRLHVASLACSTDGTTVVVLTDGGQVLRQVGLKKADVLTDSAKAAAVSPDGLKVAAAAEGVVVWDEASMTEPRRFQYEKSGVINKVAFLGDTTLVATDDVGSIFVQPVTVASAPEVLKGEGPSFDLLVGAGGKAFAVLQQYQQLNPQRGLGAGYVVVIWRDQSVVDFSRKK